MMGAISRISSSWNANAMIPFPPQFPLIKYPDPTASFHSLSTLSTFSHLHFSLHSSNFNRRRTPPPTLLTLKASTTPTTPSVGSAECTEEPATKVKFQTSLSLPSCSTPLSLLGTGYRERVFAIIGVKVYAAGLYVNQSIISTLNAWNGQSASEIQENSALFSSIFQAPFEKSLQIVLVRDVDGKDFWNALDEAISPRIKAATPVDESALSTFRSIFQGQPLKNGTSIFLTWLDSSKMLVCVSSDGKPSGVDAIIESASVTLALFDVFFGDAPVSPSLKASVANGLAKILK